MKKLLTLFLVLVLCAGMAAPAFAAEEGIVVAGENITITTAYNTYVCQGTVTENATIPFSFEGESYDMVGTRIDLKPGSTITVDGRLGPSPCEWWDEFNAYTYSGQGLSLPGLKTGAVDAQFGSLTSAETYQVDMYSDGSYFFFLGSSAGTAAPATPATPAQPEEPSQTETPAAPEVVVPDAPGSYTVKAGDTYGTIALNNYGTYGVWELLYAANNYAKMNVGTNLVLPETLANATLLPAQTLAEGETLYTVKAGDTLGSIAVAAYGRIGEYKAIFERNADRLKSANLISEGQTIVLPAK